MKSIEVITPKDVNGTVNQILTNIEEQRKENKN